MPDTVLYLRGPFPFGADQPINERFVEDAKLLLLPSDERFKSLQAALSGYAGFLSKDALEALILEFLPDKELAIRAATFILTIDERKRYPGFDVGSITSQIAEWLRKRGENSSQLTLSEGELDLLSQRLTSVFKSLPGLERQAKARGLSERIGQPLERLELICDLRPIFDVTKDNIEGMIPLTTLRLICKGPDGLPVAFDAVLSERDVSSLANASRDAKKKLKILRALLSNVGIAIPEVETTKQVISDGDEE